MVGDSHQRLLNLLDILAIVDRQCGGEIKARIIDHWRNGFREGVMRRLDRGHRPLALGGRGKSTIDRDRDAIELLLHRCSIGVKRCRGIAASGRRCERLDPTC